MTVEELLEGQCGKVSGEFSVLCRTVDRGFARSLKKKFGTVVGVGCDWGL